MTCRSFPLFFFFDTWEFLLLASWGNIFSCLLVISFFKWLQKRHHFTSLLKEKKNTLKCGCYFTCVCDLTDYNKSQKNNDNNSKNTRSAAHRSSLHFTSLLFTVIHSSQWRHETRNATIKRPLGRCCIWITNVVVDVLFRE